MFENEYKLEFLLRRMIKEAALWETTGHGNLYRTDKAIDWPLVESRKTWQEWVDEHNS